MSIGVGLGLLEAHLAGTRTTGRDEKRIQGDLNVANTGGKLL